MPRLSWWYWLVWWLQPGFATASLKLKCSRFLFHSFSLDISRKGWKRFRNLIQVATIILHSCATMRTESTAIWAQRPLLTLVSDVTLQSSFNKECRYAEKQGTRIGAPGYGAQPGGMASRAADLCTSLGFSWVSFYYTFVLVLLLIILSFCIIHLMIFKISYLINIFSVLKT